MIFLLYLAWADFDMSLMVDKDEEDIAVLVESLTNYHTLDPYMRKEAFSALRALLSNKKSTQDFFRELQGVELMISIYQEGKSQEDFEVMENALFTLGVAVERNDVSRNALLTPEFFTLIKRAMKRRSTSSMTSAFLLSCLASNNGDGQALARKTKCIHKLCELLKEAIADSDDSEHTCKICNAICSTLCAVNIDPVNESNQELCCLLIMPSLVRWLYSDISRQSLHSMISLLGSCINGNRKTKTQLRLIGGLRVLVAVLEKFSSPEEFQSNDSIYFLTQLINTLSCSYHYHEVNQVHAVELGAVELLLTCLFNAGRHAQLQKTCVTALVSLLDSDDNKQGKQKFQDHRGVQVLIEVMASSQDENLKKLVTFLLYKTCKPTLAREQSLDSRNRILRKTGKDNINSIMNFTQKKDICSVHQNMLHQDEKIGEKQRSQACNCKSTITANSHTILTVLLKHPDVCEYHNCIGQTLQAYITRKKQLQAASVE